MPSFGRRRLVVVPVVVAEPGVDAAFGSVPLLVASIVGVISPRG